MNLVKQLYLSNRFFIAIGAVALLFAFSFLWEMLYPLAQVSFVLLLVTILADGIILFNSFVNIECTRHTPKALSMGSNNTIRIFINNKSGVFFSAKIIDELPFELQERDFCIAEKLQPDNQKELIYDIRPLSRGMYHFGNTLVYITSYLGLIERKLQFNNASLVPVYPSLIEMRHYELRIMNRIAYYSGIKKMRRLGHSYEFEQIKNYVRGDDQRNINWKATGRKAQLMVNQYEDERSQQIYSVIDNSRVMRLAFNGLTLFDCAVNTSLVLSNISLLKQDKAGLITFSEKKGAVLKAEKGANQLRKIMDALYVEKESKLEANYELLYHQIRNSIKVRSLLFLYTNFESTYSLERVLPLLRKINKLHLLVVVFFENSEINEYSKKEAHNVKHIFYKTIARKFIFEKQIIAQLLRQYGIQTIYTSPQELSTNTINKYLELKSRGLI